MKTPVKGVPVKGVEVMKKGMNKQSASSAKAKK